MIQADSAIEQKEENRMDRKSRWALYNQAKAHFIKHYPQLIGIERFATERVDLDFLTLTSKKDQKKVLCVFLSQEAAKHAEKTSNGKQIYPMDQIINCVLRNPDRYCGIMFYTKDDGSRELISISKLLFYKHGRIMLDDKRMVNLLEKLTPAEKEYITEECLQVIQMVYFEEKKNDEIAQTLGISSKEVGNRLSLGYRMLTDVVQANY